MFGIGPIELTIILITSLWVLYDANKLAGGKSSVKPIGWFFLCIFLWLLAFPAYLITRPKYKAAYAQNGTAQEGTAQKSTLSNFTKLALFFAGVFFLAVVYFSIEAQRDSYYGKDSYPINSQLERMAQNDLPGWALEEAARFTDFKSPHGEVYKMTMEQEEYRKVFYAAFIKQNEYVFDEFKTIEDMNNFLELVKERPWSTVDQWDVYTGEQQSVLEPLRGALSSFGLPDDNLSVASMLAEAISYYE